MATITTTTTATLLSPTKSQIDKCNDGTLIAGIRRANGNLGFWYSKNNGTSWTDMGTGNDVAGAAAALEYAFFVDQGNFITAVYRTFTAGKDVLHFKYGKPNAGITSYTWFNDVSVATVWNTAATIAGGSWQGLDIIVVGNPAGGAAAALAFIVAGAGTDHIANGFDGFVVWAITMTTAGAYTDKTTAWFPGGGNYRNQLAGANPCWPSVDFKHTGAGKTISGVFDVSLLMLAGDGNNYARNRFTWNGNGFTSGFSFIQAGTSYGRPTNPANQARRPMRIDGQGRLLIPQLTGSDSMALVEFDASLTARTDRFPPAHPKGVVTASAVTYDTAGNIYLFAVGTTDATLYYCTYARGSNTWTAWAVVNATVLSSAPAFSVRRGTLGSRLDSITQTGAGTFTIANQAVVLTGNPFAPTWNSPPNNSAQNVAATLLLDWTFSDPDVTDTQASYAVSRQIGAGALAYWRASDSTWQPAEVQNTSTSDQLTLASGWAVATDANYTYKVKVWDTANLPSVYSAGLTIVPSALVLPTITAPAAAAVIASTSVTVTWTVAEQTAYSLLVEQDMGGGVFNTVYSKTGTVGSSFVVTGLVNTASYRISLTTTNNEGLVSSVVQRSFTTSFTPPSTPTVTFPVMPAKYSYVVGVTVVNPGGGATVVTNTVERRTGTDDNTVVTLSDAVALNGTYYDATVRSGVSYQYRATAYTAAGANAVGAWTT